MASRRLRIKPIANVPVRRGKVNAENERSDAASVADTSNLASLEPKIEVSSQPEKLSTVSAHVEIKQNTSNNKVVSTSNYLSDDICNAPTTSVLNSNSAVTTRRDNSVGAVEKECDSVSESGKVTLSNTTAVPSKNNVPPGLARKRVKPAVSISAVSRRPRELNKILDNNRKSDISSQIDNSKDVTKDEDNRSENSSEKLHVVSPGPQRSDKDISFIGNKDIVAGIPGITQIIPTGTAIRPQHDNVIGSVTPVIGKGEAPQLTCEPDLPSEGAGSGESVTPKPLSETNIKHRSRFMKHTPQIVAGIRVFHKPDDDASQKSCSSDLVKSQNVSESIIPEQKHSESKQESCASTCESDDESRRSVSEASTITPPVRKSLEISRPRFMKPTPRFIEASARRNSIQSSASESEDENRRSISIASTITPPNKRHADLKGDEPAEQNGKDEVDFSEKKVTRTRRTQSSCTLRLAKARLEFQNKYGNKTPDRSRLTMFDLIFYNPNTNPMKSSGQESRKSIESINLDNNEERILEEQVDEPSAPDDIQKEKSDDEEEEDIAMPVPQVKVGPDGQLILDEKSLVIETTGTKKSREDLANSAVIVDYGTGSTGYGTYSRKTKKSKEWSKEETLKFYRALNTVGTDFSLMNSIFPNRTRQDLKLKYKKEDRINRYLVEKALLCPLNFDLTDLEKELEEEQQEARQMTVKKLVKPPKKKRKQNYRRRNKSFLTASMDEADTGNKTGIKDKAKKRKHEPKEDKKIAKRYRTLKSKLKGNESSISSDEENELNYNYENDLKFSTVNDDDDSKLERDTSDNETAEMEYLTKPPKPTRSGRVPQPRKLIELEDNEKVGSRKKESSVSGLKSSVKNAESQPMPLEDLTNVESKTSKNSENQETASKTPENQSGQSKIPGNQSTFLENLTNVEPGSLVVLATQSPTHPGHQVYKVFMVTPNSGGAIAPVSVPLSSPLLNSVSDSFVNVEENPESSSQTDVQIGNVPEFMSIQHDEPLPGQLAELLPVKQSEPFPDHVSGFIPVQVAEPLTRQLVQLLPLNHAEPVSSKQAESLPDQEPSIQSNDLVQLLPVQPSTNPSAVFLSQQQPLKETADDYNNSLSIKETQQTFDQHSYLSVQQIHLQSDQPVELESLIESGS